MHLSKRCDGKDTDCGDGSDEKGCSEVICKSNEFKCPTGTCIPLHFACDGKPACPYGEDEEEELCENYDCGPKMLKCRNNRCVYLQYRCDTRDDCGDGTDEINCPPASCKLDEFLCSNSHCIDNLSVCDSYNDCGDNFDELNSTCIAVHRSCNISRRIDFYDDSY